jgi:hypothetical protein
VNQFLETLPPGTIIEYRDSETGNTLIVIMSNAGVGSLVNYPTHPHDYIMNDYEDIKDP